MRVKTKVWIMFGVFFALLGLVLFSAGMSLNGWDFTKLTTEKYETNTYEIKENFKDVSIHTDTADVSFVLTEEEVCKVVCHEPVKEKHAVAVQNETLSVTATDTRKWFNKITFVSFDSPCLKIYLPKTVYEKLVIELSTGDVQLPRDFSFQDIEIGTSTGDIECAASAEKAVRLCASTGDINLDGTKAGSIELSVSTGRIKVRNVVCEGEMQIDVSTGKTELTSVCCKEFTSVGTTGDISFVHTIVDDKLSVERSTGDVLFDRSDAGEIFIETSTGDVEGSLLSEKVFFTESDTGNIHVPKAMAGGKCEIKTDTGNIEIEIAK